MRKSGSFTDNNCTYQSLPHVEIRTKFLKYLRNVPIDDYSRLKESGIGKAVMYLYRRVVH